MKINLIKILVLITINSALAQSLERAIQNEIDGNPKLNVGVIKSGLDLINRGPGEYTYAQKNIDEKITIALVNAQKGLEEDIFSEEIEIPPIKPEEFRQKTPVIKTPNISGKTDLETLIQKTNSFTAEEISFENLKADFEGGILSKDGFEMEKANLINKNPALNEKFKNTEIIDPNTPAIDPRKEDLKPFVENSIKKTDTYDMEITIDLQKDTKDTIESISPNINSVLEKLDAIEKPKIPYSGIKE